MPEENVATIPVVNQQVQIPAPVVVESVEPDLITKVSRFKSPQTPASEIKNAPEQPEFESIKDPVAREAAKQAVERMRRDIQSSADRRVEDAKKILEPSKNWTPQRIQQELLNNPEFLQAAQTYSATQNPPNSGLTDEQFSALTDGEKAEMASLKSEINQLKQTNLNSAIQTAISQKDVQLQSRFADYNPIEINSATERLASMNLSDVREYVYKAQLHDEHVKAAYEMGRQEGRGITQNKINGLSPDGTTSINNDGIPTKNKGENDQSFFVRLAQRRLEESRRK